MSLIDQKVVEVVNAIRQAIETNPHAGLSVNSHPNQYFLNVIGALDLKRIAETVLARIESYDASVKARFEAEVQKLAGKIRAELKAGAADVESALKSVFSKAQGEVAQATGIVEVAQARVEQEVAAAKAVVDPSAKL